MNRNSMTTQDWDRLNIPNRRTIEDTIRNGPDVPTGTLNTYGAKDWQEFVSGALHSRYQEAFFIGYDMAKAEMRKAFGLLRRES